MRLSARSLGGAALVLAIGLTGCGGADQHVATASTGEATTSSPSTVPLESALCTDLEGVMGLPEQLSIATSSANVTEVRSAVDEAADHASAAAKAAPPDVEGDLKSMAKALTQADRTLSSSTSKDIDAPTVETMMDSVQHLFEGSAVLRVAGFQQATCR